MKTFRRGAWARTLVLFVCATFLWMAVGADSASAWLPFGGQKCHETDGQCCSDDNVGAGTSDCPVSGVCTSSECRYKQDSVNAASGNAPGVDSCIGFKDSDGPLFRVWYNSQQDGGGFGLGPKRRSTYHMRLTFPDASTVVFEDANATPWKFTKNVDGSYTPEPGYHAKLVKIPAWSLYVLTLTGGRAFWFDLNGRLGLIFSPDLNAYDAVQYDANGRLSGIEVWRKNAQGQYQGSGRKLILDYDASNRITSVTVWIVNHANGQTQFTYDTGGRVQTVTDPAGTETTYGYDSSDRITSVTRNNHTWTYGYDGANHVASITDPLSHTWTYAYVRHPGSDRIKTCTITDPNNHSTIREFDTNGRLIKLTDALGKYRSFTYDSSWNRATMTNERNQTWHYGYNSYGDMTSVTDPLNHVTTYDYGSDGKHLLYAITDPLNHTTTFAYDSGRHLTAVTDPNSNTTTYTYSTEVGKTGLLTSVTDARNNTTEYEYGLSDRPTYLTKITDPLEHATSFEYDEIGNRTSVTDARNNTSYYTYDNNGRVTQITNPDSTTRTFACNCCNLTSTTDENDKTTTYHYDNAERLSYVTDAENHETHYAYDDAGNLTSVTDANSHATSYTYDDANRLTRIDYPDSTYETFAYYDTGALETRTDGNGITTTYDRDALDRVTTIDYPGTSSDVTFTYDAEGRVTRMQDGNCDTLYHYDVWGTTEYDQLIQVQRKYGSMTSYRATSYTYDDNYNRISMTDGEGNGTSYTYNANNQLASVTRLGTTTFQYDEVGNRTLKTFPNGAYTEYTYNNRNWLMSLGNRKSDATLVSSYAYGHDSVGNRTSMTEANGDVTSYGYDAIYRLVSEEKRDSQQQTIYTYAYSYDGVGNRESMTANGAGTSYFYDDNNTLTSYVDAGGTTTFGYDSNGNTTSMTQPGPITTTYGYNYENRLTGVTNPSYTAAYTYSADGLRLRVQESNAQYTDRWFQYDGVRPVLEGTLSGDTYTTTAKYVWEGNGYYDPLVYSLIGGAWRYHLYDGLGSTRQLMLHASPYTVTDTYSYEAFGNVLSSTGTTPNPYQYVGSLGYHKSGDPHLLHLGARYYMPEVGRFIGPDPPSSRQSSGDYLYGRSSPTIWVDPSGESSWPASAPRKRAKPWYEEKGLEDCKWIHTRGDQCDDPVPGDPDWKQWVRKCHSCCRQINKHYKKPPTWLQSCYQLCSNSFRPDPFPRPGG